ncbi:hypothetical protein HJFPF1_13491 [Paramyrothecium foliicola]|nr:hypothetical protein HJFPF1_13491 [Paramyrothecium foliicola]
MEELTSLYFCNGFHRSGGKYPIPGAAHDSAVRLLSEQLNGGNGTDTQELLMQSAPRTENPPTSRVMVTDSPPPAPPTAGQRDGQASEPHVDVPHGRRRSTTPALSKYSTLERIATNQEFSGGKRAHHPAFTRNDITVTSVTTIPHTATTTAVGTTSATTTDNSTFTIIIVTREPLRPCPICYITASKLAHSGSEPCKVHTRIGRCRTNTHYHATRKKQHCTITPSKPALPTRSAWTEILRTLDWQL